MTMFDNCTRCGEPLKDALPDNPSRRRTDFPQKEEALVLEIHGGYGMFVDMSITVVILCKNCSKQFFIANDYLVRWIEQNEGNKYYDA